MEGFLVLLLPAMDVELLLWVQPGRAGVARLLFRCAVWNGKCRGGGESILSTTVNSDSACLSPSWRAHDPRTHDGRSDESTAGCMSLSHDNDFPS